MTNEKESRESLGDDNTDALKEIAWTLSFAILLRARRPWKRIEEEAPVAGRAQAVFVATMLADEAASRTLLRGVHVKLAKAGEIFGVDLHWPESREDLDLSLEPVERGGSWYVRIVLFNRRTA